MSHSSIVRTYGTRGKGRSSPDHIIIKGMKALHLLAATAWAGGAMSMQALSFIRLSSEDPVRVAQAGYCLYFVDTWIVMPGLGLCILTGLFYSLCTAIGFFKFFWIAYKWVITLAAAFWGTLFWSGLGDRLIEWLVPHGLDWPLRFVRACILPENMYEGGLQVLLILSMCLISVYRPLSLRKFTNTLSGGQRMPQLAYGVWDGIAYDNRKARVQASPPGLDLNIFAHFNEGNAAGMFMSDRGFLVLDAKIPLLWAMWRHFHRVAAESCGKCSPCRTGAPLLRDALEAALRTGKVDLTALRELASQMAQTSLCGVGKTGPQPLLQALAHFPDDLQRPGTPGKHGFYSAVTSPCIEACPGIVNIPRYIDYIKDGHDDLAANTVLRHYPLVGSCGRVCVRTCESACRRGKVDEPISIRNLKRYAADKAIASGLLKPQDSAPGREERVAVVGAGPVGISCAYHLLERGYQVDLYEAKSQAGGMIRYGIPVYRLPKQTLQEETDIVAAMGGKFFFNQKLGRDFRVDDLFGRGYSAVFISGGCPQGSYLGMDGEDTSLAEYENGIDFLERVYDGVEAGAPPVLEGDVVVVGGGNVAMDCCRAAARIATGSVHLIYRRTEADAPADHEEIAAARAEGVEFHFLCGQNALVVEDGKIVGLRVQDMERTEPDASGRRGVRPIPGTERVLPCSHVIAAIGQKADKAMLGDDEGIARDRKNCIIINAAHETSRPGVFAGGDCTSGPRATGPTTMIMGMGHAYFAARSIDRYLSTGQMPFDSRWRMSELIAAGKLLDDGKPVPGKERRARAPLRELEPAQRQSNFCEVEQTMSQEEAWAEAARCMRCYRVLSVVTGAPIPGQVA